MKYAKTTVILVYFTLVVSLSLQARLNSSSRLKSNAKLNTATATETQTKTSTLSKSQAKVSSRAEGKSKSNVKLTANGPIDWEGISDLFSVDSIRFNNNDFINPPIPAKKHQNNLHSLHSKKPLSSNQESASFRTVGPGEDSTVDYSGKKYSAILDTFNHRKVSPGYYGRSRLTRM